MRRAEALRDQLEQDIVTGHFRPGEHLDEQGLAARFGVSRTPIREALMQLASTGMIDLQPNRGAFVACLSLRDVVERFETMAALEGMCGALAARRIDDEERVTLVEAHDACMAATIQGCADTYYYANERFHRTIYGMGRNAHLAEQANQLHTLLKPYRRLQLRARHRLTQSLAEHGLIVDAIVAGNAAAAERHLRAHVLIQGERLSDFVTSFGTGDGA
ncbi:GntR family transcriptional regulator [Methylobacterium sp. Leaf118]|uniref:GntR family transcriptional regulator n=1 Tax=Methylobacterium sp. Leaf118 TaxID=2876562 RepID=UPI001E4CE1C2|nr:GntR family transcriptional regulator [Methylobacterium sp. Leaf118]